MDKTAYRKRTRWKTTTVCIGVEVPTFKCRMFTHYAQG